VAVAGGAGLAGAGQDAAGVLADLDRLTGGLAVDAVEGERVPSDAGDFAFAPRARAGDGPAEDLRGGPARRPAGYQGAAQAAVVGVGGVAEVGQPVDVLDRPQQPGARDEPVVAVDQTPIAPGRASLAASPTSSWV
jgi:hypothetical protein